MLRRWVGSLNAIRPKSKPPGYYDYLQVDLENPNRPVDDPYVFRKGENMFESWHIGVMLYMFLGVSVFYATRTVYDRDWDRYYHVNYPALMEHFDRLVHHYKVKGINTVEELPSGIRELYNDMMETISKNKLKGIKVIKVNDLSFETQMGKVLSDAMGIKDDGSFENESKKQKELVFKELD